MDKPKHRKKTSHSSILFSKRLSQIIQYFDWVASQFGLMAARFNKTTQTYKQDATLEWKVRLNYALYSFWLFAAVGIIAKYYLKKDINRYNVALAFWLPGLLVMIGFSVFYWYVHDLCIMINGFKQFMEYMYRTYAPVGYDPNKSVENRYISILSELLVWYSVMSYIFVTLLIAYNPRGVIFLGDLIPIKYFSFPVALLVILFHSYLYLIVHIICNMVSMATLVYGVYFATLLVRELRVGRNNYKLKDSLRKPENVQRIYRSLQILQANVFSVLGIFLVICNANFLLVNIFCNFVLIKYWGQLETTSKGTLLVWTVVFGVFWACLLELGRYIFLKGNKVINSWKGDKWGSTKQNKLMRRFIRSCKPIVLSYGKQFVIGRVSIIIFYRGVGRGTFRALLTTKT